MEEKEYLYYCFILLVRSESVYKKLETIEMISEEMCNSINLHYKQQTLLAENTSFEVHSEGIKSYISFVY